MVNKAEYSVGGIHLDGIRNRNEPRVVAAMREVLGTLPDFCGCSICLEDVFAIAVNRFPPRYVQRATILVREKGVPEDEMRQGVIEAFERVGRRPNHEARTG